MKYYKKESILRLVSLRQNPPFSVPLVITKSEIHRKITYEQKE